MPKRKKWKRAVLIALGLTVVLVAVSWGFWLDQARAYHLGKVELAKLPKGLSSRGIVMTYSVGLIELGGKKSTLGLPQIDRVELHLLGDESDETATNRFRTRTLGGGSYPITQSKTLRGVDADEFARGWRALECHWGLSGMCHDPAYGLRLYSGNNLILDTDLCWACSNFSVKTTWGHALCGVETTNLAGRLFWKLLQKHMPVPSPPDAKATSPR